MEMNASKAVFLSYASQDAEVARRIADALRAAGVEVWFDQDTLVGGDAWDQKIRGQVSACALFVPVISANTQERQEGYFRLEWHLAEQRSLLIAKGRPFIVPVSIDATRERGALVPDAFNAVQWTKLPGGETSAAFVSRVKKLLGDQAPSAKAAPPGTSPPSVVAPASKSGRLVWTTAAVVAALLAVFAYVATRPAKEAAPAPASMGKADKSIAVLPFSNMSDDKAASAFLSDGVHEDILTNLSNIREFRVIPRTSMEQYRGTQKKISQIAQELRVTYVLEGSARRAGDQVRVTGKLINARTEESVWAKSYDRSYANVLAIQAELATDIAQALKTALSPEEKNLVERRPTVSTAAYEQFLKAREVRRRFAAPGQNARAMEPFLLEAVRLDPNYASAYAELAYVYTIGNAATERQATLAKAQDAIDKARRLAPDSPEVILALGDFYRSSGETARALEQFERFGRLRPKDADYLDRLAETYQQQGIGFGQKTWEIRKQLEDVDPANLANLRRMVQLLLGGRRYAEAIAVQRRIWTRLPDNLEARHYIGYMTFLLDGSTQLNEQFWSEIKPDAWNLGIFFRRRMLRMQGRLDEAVSFDLTDPLAGDAETLNVAIIHAARGDVAAARTRLGDLPERLRREPAAGTRAEDTARRWIRLGTIVGVLGNRAEALQCAKRAIEVLPASRVPSIDLARLYAWAGDNDSALAELGQFLVALVDGPSDGRSVHGLRHNPNFFPLQGDPRFEALLKDPKNNAPLF